MIYVILPLGKEAPQVANWVGRILMYTAGATIGASAMAFVMGFIGVGLRALLPGIHYEWAVGALGVAAIVLALHELNIIRLPTPQIGWQVPKSWQRWGRMVGQTFYGVALGAGIFTFIPFASFYVLLALEALVGAVDLRAAVAIGFVYGLVRGLPAVLGGVSIIRGQFPMPTANWLVAHLGWWHALNALALLLVGGFFLGSFIL